MRVETWEESWKLPCPHGTCDLLIGRLGTNAARWVDTSKRVAEQEYGIRPESQQEECPAEAAARSTGPLVHRVRKATPLASPQRLAGGSSKFFTVTVTVTVRARVSYSSNQRTLPGDLQSLAEGCVAGKDLPHAGSPEGPGTGIAFSRAPMDGSQLRHFSEHAVTGLRSLWQRIYIWVLESAA